MLRVRHLLLGLAAASAFGVVLACGDDPAPIAATPDAASDSGSLRVDEHAGQRCTVAADCYPNLDAGSVEGAVVCLDRVPNGYCTHECASDSDCCAASGECRTGIKQVCAPFESTGKKMCFLSCEDGDVTSGATASAAYDGGTDEDAYCKYFAAASSSCRSTGGGGENRKVCIPKE